VKSFGRVLVKNQSKRCNRGAKRLVFRFVCEKVTFPTSCLTVLAPLGSVGHVGSCTKVLSNVVNETFMPKYFGGQFGVTFGTSR
jgi:hypothetical protein